MNEKKWGLIDDGVIIGLINNFEAKRWFNGVMEEETCASSKAIPRISPVIERSIPVLDLANKTALPKTLQP